VEKVRCAIESVCHVSTNDTIYYTYVDSFHLIYTSIKLATYSNTG